MGQKKLRPKSDIQFELRRMMVSRDFLEFFEVHEVKELSNEWQIILHEKEYLIRFLANNFGMKDRNFFLYRIAG